MYLLYPRVLIKPIKYWHRHDHPTQQWQWHLIQDNWMELIECNHMRQCYIVSNQLNYWLWLVHKLSSEDLAVFTDGQFLSTFLLFFALFHCVEGELYFSITVLEVLHQKANDIGWTKPRFCCCHWLCCQLSRSCMCHPIISRLNIHHGTVFGKISLK
jgi:hypothetical protein